MPTKSKVQFFGEVDMDKNGKITSEMPAWYLERHIEYMEEDILRKENALKNNRIIAEQVPMVKEQIKQEKKQLERIVNSKPDREKFSSAQKDACWRTYESLKKQIQDTLPTRKQAKDGLVNPYDELQRLKKKHITISPEMASSLGLKPVQGKVSGDEANKAFQILGKVLGEPTNTESLRRDGNSESYQTIHDLTKAILDGREIKD